MSKWTVLYYMNADHEDYADEGLAGKVLKGLAGVGSGENLSILVLLDRYKRKGAPGTAKYKPRLYLVEKDKKITMATPPLYQVNSENMGNPAILEDSLVFAMQQFPADHYGLVVWDHGAGYAVIGHMFDEMPAAHALDGETPGRRNVGITRVFSGVRSPIGFPITEHQNRKDDGYLYPAEISIVIKKTIGRAAFVAFDACWMATVENLYALRDATDILIGSENTLLNDGLQYAGFLKWMKNGNGPAANMYKMLTGETFQWLKKEPYCTVSALSTHAMDELAGLIDAFSHAAAKKINNEQFFKLVYLSRMFCLNFYYDGDPFVGLDVIDLRYFFEKLRYYLEEEFDLFKAEFGDSVNAILALLDKPGKLVTAAEAGKDVARKDDIGRMWGASGVSIFFPEDPFYFQYFVNADEWYFAGDQRLHPFTSLHWKAFLVAYFAMAAKSYGVGVK